MDVEHDWAFRAVIQAWGPDIEEQAVFADFWLV